MPHINDTSVSSNLIFDATNNVVVYGDSSAKIWVNNMNADLGSNRLTYKSISEYKPNVTSNTGIATTVNYNGTYTFSTNKSVKAYYKYKSSIEELMYGTRKISMLEIPVSKSGDKYTISNIKTDIYIEVK